jgi:4-carboxymuconolactone decarboxylase
VARLPDVDPVSEVSERVRTRRGGTLTPLDRMLLHSEPLADGWNTLLGAVRSRFELAADLRELAICRVAALNDAGYEWRAHAPLLVDAGFPEERLPALRGERLPALRDERLPALRDERLPALRAGGDPAALTAEQRTVVAYTDAMTRDVRVPAELFTEVRELLGDRGTVELTATVAAYNMVSRVLVALEVGEER